MDEFKSIFIFSRGEKNGIAVLTSLIIILFLIPYSYPLFLKPPKQAVPIPLKWIDSLQLQEAQYTENKKKSFPSSYPQREYKSYSYPKKEYPNRNYASKNFGNSKGHSPKQSKYFSDTSQQYAPRPAQQKYYSNNSEKEFDQNKPYRQKKFKEAKIIDVNKASLEDWQQLRGIGAYRAKTIVRFREALGGFKNIEQLAECYALPDSVYQKITPFLRFEEIPLRQLDLNTLSADSLRLHPYINWKYANAIVRYREQHGHYQKVEDLNKLHALPKDFIEKIKDYFIVKGL